MAKVPVPDQVSGTEGYAEVAEASIPAYECIPFEKVHGDVMHLFPPAPARVLDVGAGSGRDAAAYAEIGHDVVAVEPVAPFREAAKALHTSRRIEWIDDSLPALKKLGADQSFDLVSLSAVWMHLDAEQRDAAMGRLAALLRPKGVLTLSLRHGPVPEGKRMFDVTGEETIALAGREGLRNVLYLESQPSALSRPDVTWTRLAFAK